MNRRELLLGLSGMGAIFSGCLGKNVFSNKNTGDISEDELFELTRVEVANRSTKTYTVHVLVFAEGELATWTSMNANPMDTTANQAGGGPIESTWPDKARTYTVYARLDREKSWQKLTVSNEDIEICTEVFITIDDRGIRLWFTDKCPDGS